MHKPNFLETTIILYLLLFALTISCAKADIVDRYVTPESTAAQNIQRSLIHIESCGVIVSVLIIYDDKVFSLPVNKMNDPNYSGKVTLYQQLAHAGVTASSLTFADLFGDDIKLMCHKD